MKVSLFFFASDEQSIRDDKYRLLLEAARFADQNGFWAVWTPERHFHRFGGLYPNPSLLGAAMSSVTARVRLHAGSVVLPLHDPIRVAEEWSVVDNLSRGRAGVAISTGWLARDFALAPQNFDDRKETAIRNLEILRRLWLGEEIEVSDGDGKPAKISIFPKPVQRELPIWITTGFNPAMFERAGAVNAKVLTALLSLTVDDLADRIGRYWRSRRDAGLDPEGGGVTVMLHTFLGDDVDEVRQVARYPFYEYLKSHSGLVRSMAQSLNVDLDGESFTEDDQQALAEFAFERYFSSAALLGTTETSIQMIDRLEAIGVTEVACLIDFGIDVETVLGSLEKLAEVVAHYRGRRAGEDTAR